MERNARALLSFLPLLLATSACIVPLGKLGEEDTESESDGASGSVDPTGEGETSGGEDTAGPDTDGDTDSGGPPVPTERQVDILFVVDNSGTMSEEQANLASAIDALVGTLDSAPIPVDYRIAVTTTDNGNPWCAGTGPEAGKLRATSCRSRAQEFTFNGATMIESFDETCAAYCPEGMDDLAISDGVPWIDVQRSTGTSNVGDAVVDSLRCMLPQGIDGCGFEQPLESARKAMLRFDQVSEPSFGFHRPGALLAVMFVSDEVDCSYNSAHEDIFLPDGGRVFWSDPSAASPTSAICFNAGVACTSDGAGGLDCAVADLDAQGDPGAAPNDAVLHPVTRYTSALLGEGAFVSGIYGVGLDGSLSYAPSVDPLFQNDFGVGANCQSSNGAGVPPARTYEVVDALGGDHSSICAGGYQAALTAFGQGILARLP